MTKFGDFASGGCCIFQEKLTWQQKKIINILYEKQHHHVWALSAQYLHARYFLLIAFTMVVVYLQDCKIHFATLSWTSKRKPPTTEIKGVNPGNRHLNPCTQLPKVMAYLQFLMSNSHRESCQGGLGLIQLRK